MYESEKIKQAIRECGFSQREFASKLGVSQPTVNGFVSGRNRPTARTLKRIAKITGKDLAYFMPGNSANTNLEVEIMFLRQEIEKLKQEIALLKEKKK